MNSRLLPGAVNPTTVLATTNTGWPLWRAWSPRRGWPIQPRSLHEKKPGPPPTETLLTASPSNCFNRAAPEARWLLLGLACTFATYWMLQHASVEPLGEVGSIGRPAAWDSLRAPVWAQLLGMRHALEPDHLAAVSTLMTGERSSAKAAWLGAWWGLGHTLTLLTAGALLVVLQAEMPAIAAQVFEFCVVLLLVGFGVRAIYQGACRVPAGPTHSHTKTRSSVTLSHGPMDTRTTTPGGRRAWTGGQRRADRARGDDAPVNGDTAGAI